MKPLQLSNGSLELLKWLALVVMFLDHVNKYIFIGGLSMAFELGRLCLPLFTILLAYNLARPGVIQSGAGQRTMTRMAIFGTLASVPFIGLGGLTAGWWPLNVMFTLLITTITILLINKGSWINWLAATLVALVGGSLVEFWWPAIALGVLSWLYFKHNTRIFLIGVLAACASLWFVNGNHWALLALPIIFAVSKLDFQLPRLKWAFYAFYPLHLAALWYIRTTMENAGYLFL